MLSSAQRTLEAFWRNNIYPGARVDFPKSLSTSSGSKNATRISTLPNVSPTGARSKGTLLMSKRNSTSPRNMILIPTSLVPPLMRIMVAGHLQWLVMALAHTLASIFRFALALPPKNTFPHSRELTNSKGSCTTRLSGR